VNDDRDLERIEHLLRQTADDLRGEYPPTPPIAVSVRGQLAQRRTPVAQQRLRVIARSVALAAAIFIALMLISPDVREAVARFFGLETVRIERVPTLPAPTPSIQLTIQPSSPPTLEPAGLTTLDDARAQARFNVRLPGYPPDLGQPERVYFQTFGGDAQQVILVYSEFVLYEAEDVIYQKSIDSGTMITETRVNGHEALWLSGARHLIQVYDASGKLEIDFARLIEGNVLAWEADGITYRIETKQSLEEALRIAQSMK